MKKDFKQEAAQLIIKGQIIFYGYRVVVCPVPRSEPSVTTDFRSDCYCVNLPADWREYWSEWAEKALTILHRNLVEVAG